eukprot:m.144875 g.144875  ORF g.144875 m.144875 type:complete len:67 (+) comp17723_c0_seq1:1235-1435(+)
MLSDAPMRHAFTFAAEFSHIAIRIPITALRNVPWNAMLVVVYASRMRFVVCRKASSPLLLDPLRAR